MKRVVGIFSIIVFITSAVYASNIELKQNSGTDLEIIGDENKTYSIQLIELNTKGTDNINSILQKYESGYEKLNLKLETKLKEHNKIKIEYQKDTTKKEEYIRVINEYNNIVDEIDDLENKKNKEIKEYIPTFRENNWIKIEDNKFKVDEKYIENQNILIVWIKEEGNDIEYTYKLYNSFYSESREKENVIILDANEVKMNKGKNYKIDTEITEPIYLFDKLKWESSDEKVATVKDGTIKSKNVGECTITVSTTDGRYSETCKVIIVENKTTKKIIFNIVISLIVILAVMIVDKIYLKRR